MMKVKIKKYMNIQEHENLIKLKKFPLMLKYSSINVHLIQNIINHDIQILVNVVTNVRLINSINITGFLILKQNKINIDLQILFHNIGIENI